MTTFPLMGCFTVAALVASPAAQAALLVNGGFGEQAGVVGFTPSPGAIISSQLPGWQVTITNGFAGVSNDNGFATDTYNLYMGGQSVTAFTDPGSRPAASPGTEYRLSVRSLNEGNQDGFAGAIEFFDADGALISSARVATLGAGAGPNVSATYELTGTAPVGTVSAGVRLSTINGTVLFDDVALVPEPGSLALGSLGLLVLMRRRATGR